MALRANDVDGTKDWLALGIRLLEIGRTMTKEFGEEKIVYLITVAPTVSNDAD